MILVRIYDAVAGSLDRVAMPFERKLGASADAVAMGWLYGERAAPVMRLQSLLTANIRVWVIFLACLLADPRLFWWIEIVPLTVIAIIGLIRHRGVERGFLRADAPLPILLSSEQGHS
jgi:hypothetical protein